MRTPRTTTAPEEMPPKVCDNCGRKFRSFDALHMHWILYSCSGPREKFLVEQERKKPTESVLK